MEMYYLNTAKFPICINIPIGKRTQFTQFIFLFFCHT